MKYSGAFFWQYNWPFAGLGLKIVDATTACFKHCNPIVLNHFKNVLL